jgi:transcriptional regulator with XRE-family HTH domain
MLNNAIKMHEKKVLNRIKSVLADKGRTNIWLAERLGIAKTTVSKWCTNDQQPTLDTLFQIAELLETDVRDLLVSNIPKR